MKNKTSKLKILFNKYLTRIIDIVDFVLLEEDIKTKEKLIVKIFYNLDKSIKQNRIKSPEFIYIYKTCFKQILKTKSKNDKIDIKKLKNFYNVFSSIDFDLVKKAASYIEFEDRFILLLTNKHKITAKELSLMLDKTEGYIYSNLTRTKKFILDFYVKDNIKNTKTNACFFIENQLEKFKQDNLKESKKLEIKNHLENCLNCSSIFNNFSKIDAIINNFEIQKFTNIAEKVHVLIDKKLSLNKIIIKIFKTWQFKLALSLALFTIFAYNLTFPEFKFKEFERINNDAFIAKINNTTFNEEPRQVIDNILEIEEKSINISILKDTANNENVYGPFLNESYNSSNKTENNINIKDQEEKQNTFINNFFVYKLTTISNKWQEIDSILLTNIEKYNATQAGNLALGSESNSGSYYHMYIDLDKLDDFLKDINLLATFSTVKETETRNIPKNKARMVIWIGRN